MPEPLVVVLARDPGLRSALHRLLRREGFSVSSRDADHEGGAEDVRGVLVDARLLTEPGTDLSTLMRTFPSAPVLVMAGRSDHPALTRAVLEGALALTADFDVRRLVETLRGDDGLAGVREPRRPRPPSGARGAVLDLPDGG